jgi:hypothetical protein
VARLREDGPTDAELASARSAPDSLGAAAANRRRPRERWRPRKRWAAWSFSIEFARLLAIDAPKFGG